MHLSPFLAVAAKAHVSVMDALPHLAGMLMVMVTLTILWGVCALTAKLIQILMPAQEAAPVAVAAARPAPPAPAGIQPEIVAAIAAAVAVTTGRQHRIISIKRMSGSWEKAGRQSVLTSHRIR